MLGLGSIAGGLAAAITNPLDIVTVRLMTQGVQLESAHGTRLFGIMHGLAQIYRAHGICGLWKGTTPRVLNVVPQTGLSFAIYETMKQYFVDLDLENAVLA